MSNAITDLAVEGRELYHKQREAAKQAKKERSRIRQAQYQRAWRWRQRIPDASPERYQELLREQQGCCKLCGQPPKQRSLSYTAMGLLCTRCLMHWTWLEENKDRILAMWNGNSAL